MGFNDFVGQEHDGILFLEEGLAVRRITSAGWNAGSDGHKGVHSILAVRKGSLALKINGKDCLLTENCLADIVDVFSYEVTGVSKDLIACHLVFTEDFLSDIIRNKPPFPHSYMMEIHENPIFVMEEETAPSIWEGIDVIESALRKTEHHFRTQLVESAFWMFLLDVANAYIKQRESARKGDGTGHMQALFIKFMLLLPKKIKEERSVSYYASRLCITPQYLNRIVRKFSGRSASDTINVLLIGEIIRLLDDTDQSVQEIAYLLHFADQATMTKFFKRHKGISPSAYRKKKSPLKGVTTSGPEE